MHTHTESKPLTLAFLYACRERCMFERHVWGNVDNVVEEVLRISSKEEKENEKVGIGKATEDTHTPARVRTKAPLPSPHHPCLVFKPPSLSHYLSLPIPIPFSHSHSFSLPLFSFIYSLSLSLSLTLIHSLFLAIPSLPWSNRAHKHWSSAFLPRGQNRREHFFAQNGFSQQKKILLTKPNQLSLSLSLSHIHTHTLSLSLSLPMFQLCRTRPQTNTDLFEFQWKNNKRKVFILKL